MGAGYSMRARGNASADIFLYDDIGGGFFGGISAKGFADDLKALGSVDKINLHINSPGGEVFDGMAIYRQLADHKAKVIAHVDGLAASIASVIAMAADEIEIAEAGFFMIHNASAVGVGDAKKMRDLADRLEMVSETIADVYAARTGGERADIIAMMAAETWMTGKEAVEKGFATRVVENMRLTAHAAAMTIDASKHQFRNMPNAFIKPVTADRPQFEAAQDRLTLMQAKLRQNKLRSA